MFAPGRKQRWKFPRPTARLPVFQYQTQKAFHFDRCREKYLPRQLHGAIQ